MNERKKLIKLEKDAVKIILKIIYFQFCIEKNSDKNMISQILKLFFIKNILVI